MSETINLINLQNIFIIETINFIIETIIYSVLDLNLPAFIIFFNECDL